MASRQEEKERRCLVRGEIERTLKPELMISNGTTWVPIVDEIMKAQADLQNALGMYRLRGEGILDGQSLYDYIEDHLARCLARLHKLLDELGRPMYSPATHPDINVE